MQSTETDLSPTDAQLRPRQHQRMSRAEADTERQARANGWERPPAGSRDDLPR